MSTSKRTLVYGIGNPYRCDDAVGIKVAQEIAEQIKSQDIDVKWGSIDGVAILDEIVDYHRVIFIDSIKTNKGKPGDVYKIKQPSGKSTETFSSHGINFLTAIRFGEKFKLNMPVQIDVYAVEIKDNTSFTEECTADVLNSIPKVVQVILEEIKETDGTKLRKNQNRI
ncbi:MAG: hydrogenase maturation protease [candidate division WOR-3 bacterium]|nr:MAG: hydrogenase maturation protease [candidate division WOR-3 bacterium]